MLLGLNTTVYCEDQSCGVIRYLIIQQELLNLTYLVVLTNTIHRMVPISKVSLNMEMAVELTCSQEEFLKLNPFIDTKFTQEPLPEDGLLDGISAYKLPGGQMGTHISYINYNIPSGEYIISRKTKIEVKKGHLGQFKEIIIDPQTFRITHLVFQPGHMWERKREIVPASAIDRLEGDTICLKLSGSDK